MSGTLFISDLHLDPARPEVTRAFTQFLRTHRRCERLYILGDLFEAWLGDDDDAPIAIEVCQLLRDFSDAGPALAIMPGNRDFLIGRRFCKFAGAELLTDPTVIDLYGERVLLMHGDSLCTADQQYQQFRRTVRDPAWQADLLSHSLAERRELAGRLRSMSREANSNKAEDIMDVAPEAVAEAMRQHAVRQLIHGHTHRPARHEVPTGLRWVLGDWADQGWALEVFPDEKKLRNFDI
jgi:UDP-2,3-diacylglucosamine hydrolase